MIVQCKEEDVEKNGYTHADRQKCNTMTQTSLRTGLGKNVLINGQISFCRAQYRVLAGSVCCMSVSQSVSV